jgi:hypothetical protein
MIAINKTPRRVIILNDDIIFVNGRFYSIMYVNRNIESYCTNGCDLWRYECRDNDTICNIILKSHRDIKAGNYGRYRVNKLISNVYNSLLHNIRSDFIFKSVHINNVFMDYNLSLFDIELIKLELK